jgi:protein gp37
MINFRWKNNYNEIFVNSVRNLLHEKHETFIQKLNENINDYINLLTQIYHEAGECMRMKFKFSSNQPACVLD